MTLGREPLRDRDDVLELLLGRCDGEVDAEVEGRRGHRGHEVGALHTVHRPTDVADVAHVADDDLGSRIAQGLGPVVVASDHRTDANGIGVIGGE